MERRGFIGLGAVAAAGLAGWVGSGCEHQPSEAERAEHRRRIAERVSSEELVKAFMALPGRTRQATLAYLDDFTLHRTGIGELILKLQRRVRVPQRLDPQIGMSRYYNPFTNAIYHKPLEDEAQILLYLHGEPPSFLDGHERIHAIQDAACKWDEFESFCAKLDAELIEPDAEIALPEDQAAVFARDWLKDPYRPYQKSLAEFKKLVTQYRAEVNERALLYELDAFLTFFPVESADELYQRMDEVGLGYEARLDSVPREKFDQAFAAMLELVGARDPIAAAEFVGREGLTVKNFLDQIDALRKNPDFRHARDQGLARQRALRQDVDAIRFETERVIDREQAKLGKK